VHYSSLNWVKLLKISLRYDNSTPHSPMGNTKTKWRKFFGREKGEKFTTKKFKFGTSFPSSFLVFHLQACRFVASSTYPTWLRLNSLTWNFCIQLCDHFGNFSWLSTPDFFMAMWLYALTL
jgi:hypothetical protein